MTIFKLVKTYRIYQILITSQIQGGEAPCSSRGRHRRGREGVGEGTPVSPSLSLLPRMLRKMGFIWVLLGALTSSH